MRWTWIAAAAAVACSTPETRSPAPAAPSASTPLEVVTDSLPTATLGETYTAWIDARGGAPPYTVSLASGPLPDGLVLNPAGALSGVPTAAGSASVALAVTDREGATALASLSLSVVPPGDWLACGDEQSGRFDAVAVEDWGDTVDWDATGGYTWLRLPVPPPDVTRLSLQFDSSLDLYAFLGDPGVQPGHKDLDDMRWYWVGYGGGLAIDLESRPDLETWWAHGQPLSLLVATANRGDWSVQATCTDAPVMTGLDSYPTLLGDALTININVSGEYEGLTFSASGLPDWASMNPDNGVVANVAAELGAWVADVQVEVADGRVGSGTLGFGVYEIDPLACGETRAFLPEESYYEGRLTGWYDPSSYAVLETVIDPDVSTVSLTATGWYGSLAQVAPGSAYPFYGGLDWQWFDASTARISRGPASWPPLSQHQRVDGALRTVVTAWELDGSPIDIAVSCDRAPRMGHATLPALQDAAAESMALPVVGGTPPIAWSAEGLPDGVSLSADGVLTSDGAAAGETAVTLTLEDSVGASSVEVYALRVGRPPPVLASPGCGAARRGPQPW